MILKNIILISLLAVIIFGCSKDKDPANYLKEVLNNLEQINSATYNLKGEGYAPGDTLPFSTAFTYVKEYSNPADTFVGASFIKFRSTAFQGCECSLF